MLYAAKPSSLKLCRMQSTFDLKINVYNNGHVTLSNGMNAQHFEFIRKL